MFRNGRLSKLVHNLLVGTLTEVVIVLSFGACVSAFWLLLRWPTLLT